MQIEAVVRNDWRIIALLLPDITNRFFIEVTEAIEYTALQRGYQLLLCNSRHQGSLEAVHIRQLAARGVDGVIIGHDPNQEPPETLHLLEEAEIPFVFLFSNPRAARYDSVVLDEQSGVQQALKYLFSLGHREIAYCRTAGIVPHPRETAYRNILTEQGLTVRESHILSFEKLEGAAGQEAVRKLLGAKRKMRVKQQGWSCKPCANCWGRNPNRPPSLSATITARCCCSNIWPRSACACRKTFRLSALTISTLPNT